jgi:hypothetical protein
MSAAGSYPPTNVKTPSSAPADEPRQLDRSAARDPSDARTLAERVDLTGLSIAGITRRHVGWVAAGFVSIWIVIAFARQVGDAGAAANHAAQLADDNAALAAEVQSLQGEANLIVRRQYVALAARGAGLGEAHEIPFTLSPSVAAPVDGAPGSASVRLGAASVRQTPLESWLSLLFGPSS